MKRILTIAIIIMNLLNLFGCKAQNENDPYWEFNKTVHFRPELNKAEFFKLSGFDFGWFVLEPISKFVKDKEYEIERGKSLSYGQKALYYWWYLDAQVTNGGFVQFYYNGYEPYVPTIIKGLEHIGDTEMANLIKKADKIYQKNKKLMDKAQESDLFGSDLYDRLDKMSLLDDDYYEINEKTMSLIEAYIRENPNEICLDEDGEEFDMNFSGLCKTFYDNKTIKEEFQLQKGVINGEFKSFYENGKPKEIIQFSNGQKTGELKEFYKNGQLRKEVTRNSTKGLKELKHFFENGQQSKLEYRDADDNKKGDYKEWYENGQLKEHSTNIGETKRNGYRVEYWSNGNKKIEVDFKEGKTFWKNYWNEDSKQTLIDGTGICITEWSSFKSVTTYETEYKNYLKHGKSRTIREGIVSLEQEFQEGKEDGITKSYYNNGSLKEETLYKMGEVVSKKEFAIFENPVVVTSIICEMEDEWLINRELEIADSYPVILNKDVLEKGFKADISVFDGYPQDHELSYSYFVEIDKDGKPIKLDFLVADNGFLTTEVESSIKKMKFKPAKKNGENINSYLIIKHKLKLGE
ncbi:DMP19 family protein [Tenacibaculum ascidiaceicola]|uniref:DMP19 family protein n=1 Tax=Tenacibaculum ascidiaceicola TaxID=1699411 RepID=UPI0038961B53